MMAHMATCAEETQWRSRLPLDGRGSSFSLTPLRKPQLSGWRPTTVPGTIWVSPEGGSHYILYRKKDRHTLILERKENIRGGAGRLSIFSPVPRGQMEDMILSVLPKNEWKRV